MTSLEGWTTHTLAEFIELQRGFDLPHRARRPGSYKVLSSGKAHGWHDAAKVTGPGFVVGRATNIGRPTWSDDDFWPLNTTLFAKDFKGNDPKFAYYWFLGHDLSAFNSGSVQPMLNRNYIANVPIVVPPVDEQRAIAATLGALDDKIESNRRAVAAARQLIRAHYDAAPKQRVTASQVLTPVLGGTPKRDVADYWNGTVKWASAKDIAGAEGGFLLDTAETVSAQGIDNSAAKVMPAGTVVMTARGTVGALARLSEPMAFNQSCYGLRTRAGHEATLLTALEASVTRIKDSGHGTVFNTVNMATFDQIELEVPDDPGVDILLEDLSRKILQSMKEDSRLTALRDALLPELLSGRVRVPVEGAEA